MPPGYAADTRVSEEKTRAEIETLLGKHGATSRAIFTNEEVHLAQVMFVIRGFKYRLDVPLPMKADLPKKNEEPRGWFGWSSNQRDHWRDKENAQERRARWRAMLLLLKAKLELVRLGMTTIEKEFLADMVLKNGVTMHVQVAEAIKKGLETGTAPMLALPEIAGS